MDLITQGLLGGTVGCGITKPSDDCRKLTLIGIAFGLFPDADILITFFSKDPFAPFIYHRAFTHSLFFAPLIALIARFIFKANTSITRIIFWALLTHPLLDFFTNSGVQLFHPFSNHRFSLNSITTIDFFYSTPLMIAIALGTTLKRSAIPIFYAKFSLFFTSCYLFLGLLQHDVAHKILIEESKKHNWQGHGEAFAHPTNTFHRKLVFYEKTEIHTSTINLWKNNKKIIWHKEKQSNCILNTQTIKKFKWFTDNNILYRKEKDGYILEDVRSNGWALKVGKNGHFLRWHKKPSILSRLKYELSLTS